jgi:hypothetical protein
MSTRRKKKVQRKHVRSYRKTALFLWAFGAAGLALGLVLIAVFGWKQNWPLAGLGFVYVLVAGILFGVGGVLVHVDDDRKQQRESQTHSQQSS